MLYIYFCPWQKSFWHLLNSPVGVQCGYGIHYNNTPDASTPHSAPQPDDTGTQESQHFGNICFLYSYVFIMPYYILTITGS